MTLAAVRGAKVEGCERVEVRRQIDADRYIVKPGFEPLRCGKGLTHSVSQIKSACLLSVNAQLNSGKIVLLKTTLPELRRRRKRADQALPSMSSTTL